MEIKIVLLVVTYFMAICQARAKPLTDLVPQGEGFGGNSLHTKDPAPFFNDPENTNLITGIPLPSSQSTTNNNQQPQIIALTPKLISSPTSNFGVPLPSDPLVTQGNQFIHGVPLPLFNQGSQRTIGLTNQSPGVPLPSQNLNINQRSTFSSDNSNSQNSGVFLNNLNGFTRQQPGVALPTPTKAETVTTNFAGNLIGVPLPTGTTGQTSSNTHQQVNQGRNSGIPLSQPDGSFFLRSSDSLSQSGSVGVPLPTHSEGSGGNTASQQHTQQRFASFGVPLPNNRNANQQSSGSQISSGVPLPGANEITSQPRVNSNLGISSSSSRGRQAQQTNFANAGVPLPGANSISTLSEASLSNIGVSLPNQVNTNQNINQGSSAIGIPLPAQNSISSARNGNKNTRSEASLSNIGVSLPNQVSTNQNINQGSSAIGIPLPAQNSISSSSNGNIGEQLSSVGVSLPETVQQPRFIGESVGAPIPTGSIKLSTPVITNSPSVPLPTGGSSGSVTNLLTGGLSSQSVGVQLPNFGLSTNTVGSAPSVGVSLPETKQEFTSSLRNTGTTGLTSSIGIPIPQTSGNAEQLQTSLDQNIQLFTEMLSRLTQGAVQNPGVPLPAEPAQVSAPVNSGDKQPVVIEIGPEGELSQNRPSLDIIQDMTVGDLLRGINGQNGIMVVPVSSVLGEASAAEIPIEQQESPNLLSKVGVNIPQREDLSTSFSGSEVPIAAPEDLTPNSGSGVPIPSPDLSSDGSLNGGSLLSAGDSTGSFDSIGAPAVIETSSTTIAPITSTRRGRPTTTTPKPFFRDYLSDLLYSKGQFFGTVLGGLIDYGRITYDVFQKEFGNRKHESVLTGLGK